MHSNAEHPIVLKFTICFVVYALKICKWSIGHINENRINDGQEYQVAI